VGAVEIYARTVFEREPNGKCGEWGGTSLNAAWARTSTP